MIYMTACVLYFLRVNKLKFRPALLLSCSYFFRFSKLLLPTWLVTLQVTLRVCQSVSEIIIMIILIIIKTYIAQMTWT